MQVGLFIIIFLSASSWALQFAKPLPKSIGASSHIAGGETQPAVERETLTDLIDWIASKTGWDKKDVPTISFVSPTQLNEMQFGKASGASGITCKALYKTATQTIYLSNAWNASDLCNRSYLLHELVHHLQAVNHDEAACDGDRDRQAYKLQFDWLGEQGVRDPQAFIGIGDMALFMATQCPLYRACEFLPEGCDD